jgi:hypothetical protein
MEINMLKLKNLKVTRLQLQLIKESCRARNKFYESANDPDWNKLRPELEAIIKNVDSAAKRK